jgi:hypothetical protein
MKKITVLLFMALVAIHTNAQKSGTLQINHYGAFTGAQWEGFLNRENAAEFEKYSNIKLSDFLDKQVTPYVKDQLKETSIASAMDNSTMEEFPAAADVMTMNNAGEWKKRTVRPGESGFFHHPTGTYWLSFSCGNLMVFGPGPKKPAPSVAPMATPAALATTRSAEGSSGTTNNFNLASQINSNNEQLLLGMKLRENHLLVDALIFKDIQDSKQCCGGSTGSKVQTISYAQPSMVTYAQAAPIQQQAQNSNIYVRNKPNVLDYINTAANVTSTVFSGINTFRGVRLEGNRNLISNSGYSNTWGGNNGGGRTVFQDSNQLISSNTGGGYGGGNSTVSYGGNTNTW